MSGAQHDQGRKRRPSKMFLISTDLKVHDQLEGTIRLQRGFMCQEQDASRNRGDWLWVKVLDNGVMVKIDRKFLLEIPGDLTGLLEPVTDPEARLKLLADPEKLRHLLTLPLDAPLWVQIGQKDELAEAELKYMGPLTRGGSGVCFGVQLKGTAAGKGVSNGSYKGQRLFICPEACALFLPVSDIRLRHWSSRNDPDSNERARERDHRRSGNNHSSNGHHSNNSRNHHHQQQQQQQNRHHTSFHQQGSSSSSQVQAPGIVPRMAESAPITAQNRQPSPPQFAIGQRVCFPLEENVGSGEVRFCGLLPGRPSSGMYVGILLVSKNICLHWGYRSGKNLAM